MSCPSVATMSAWLDDELGSAESRVIRSHLEDCAACREQVLGWVGAVRQSSFPRPLREACPEPGRRGRGEDTEHESRARLTACLDEEALVSYSEAELSVAETARAEEHLQQCEHCVSEVQRLIRLRVSVAEAPPAAAPAKAPAPVALVPARWRERVLEWLRSFGGIIAQPWPAMGAIAATALLVLVVARVLPRGDVGFRGPVASVQKVAVIADEVIAHARPSDDEPVVATIGRGTVATRLEDSGDWTRIELADGRRVWVRTAAVSRLEQAPP